MKNYPLWFSFIEIGNLDYLLEGIMYNGGSKRLAYILAYDNEPITKIILEM